MPPKIKVEADLSSFDAELNKLKASIAQMGDQLKNSSGKAHFNFNGSQAELNKLITQTEKLTSALDKGDKKSSQYLKNLKAMSTALADAAKVSAQLESAGDSRTNNASRYFRDYSGDLRHESSDVASQAAINSDRERTLSRIDSERQASNARWAGRAARLAGFAGGSILGGGGGYSTLGAGIGSMLPGPFGMIGGALGGAIGGAADRTIGSSRAEARTYSELRRELGSTTTDFVHLRDSVRSVVDHMGIADKEAANLAKTFAKTAGLTGDEADAIARGVGTSAGFAQGYGISPDQATSFFASMKLVGSTNNDKDSRRLALLIAESVQKGGTSAKMEEVLSSISSFASKSALQTLTAPNVGGYASYLSTATGSQYSGLKGDPTNAAQLIGAADNAVLGGGTMGEASQFHWLQARQNAFSGMSALDNSTMQGAGLMGSLSAQFKPGSAVYDRAMANGDQKTIDQMNRTRHGIDASGMDTNLAAGMKHIKNISHGDSYLENANFRGMFGGNTQQAAALMQFYDKDKGLGELESKLKDYGVSIDKNMNVAQVSSMAQLVSGGDPAMAKQYEKLLGSGKLSKDELDKGDNLMAHGYGDDLKKYLLELTAKYDTDDGLDSQKSQIDISNKIERAVSSLIPIENDMRSALLGLLERFDSGNPFLKVVRDREAAEKQKNIDAIKGGVSGSGLDEFGGVVYPQNQKIVDDMLDKMNKASPEERKEIASAFQSSRQKSAKKRAALGLNDSGYPAETDQWIAKALASEQMKSSLAADDDSVATMSAQVAPASGRPNKGDLAARLMQDNPELKDFQAAALVGGLAAETGDFKSMQEKGPKSGRGGYGWAQWTGSRRKKFEAYAKDHGGVDSFDANYGFLNKELQGDENRAFKKLLGTSNLEDAALVAQNSYERPNADLAHFDKRLGYAQDTMDQMPSSQQKTQGPNRDSVLFRHDIGVTLQDMAGNKLAAPMVSTTFGAPAYAGS